MEEIPKIIHYCWFGGKPIGKKAKRCIKSWKKYLPDFEIQRWDESNFDVNMIPFTSEAYAAKKFAFLTDYARFWILYNHGGLYFDIDVELIKPLHHIVANGAFMGCERDWDPSKPAEYLGVNPGLGVGGPAGHPFFKKMMGFYQKRHFFDENGNPDYTTVVNLTTNVLVDSGLKNSDKIQRVEDVNVYPRRYFCPMDIDTRQIELSEDTCSIHYYNGSWLSRTERFKSKIKPIVGARLTRFVIGLKGNFFRR
ncbi:MAG: glycosyl transferase [Paramuribaculum sp.]|nr:glycosyl transferase [Paramuribaculum sp.]